jgi:predicted ATPase/DNA-binding XRE family transcriptional regulator
MTYDLSFGQWMVQRRKELRLQRTELAIQIGCAAITLRKIEADERRPSQQLAELLATRFGLAGHDREAFVRVARGEWYTDRLPLLPLALDTAQPVAIPQAIPAQGIQQIYRNTNLPHGLTEVVGREEQLGEIAALLDSQRLITLTGVGGVGKTRLALEAGIEALERQAEGVARDGVWLVELAALAQPELVSQALARTFRITEQAGQSDSVRLREYLAEKQLLLILDNCEHLIDACAALAEDLLQHCWHIRILATSREPLHIAGEQMYAVPPLSIPASHTTQLDAVLASGAAQLFVARIQAHGRRTPITDQHATAIAQICRQLDGIPLALELAAPLTQSLSLVDIADQLQHQMAVLNNGYRTAIPRHQTMHSALVWSYRLLAPAEQQLLANAAVFAGGWLLDAAQAVCVEEPLPRVELLLRQLISKSLVLSETVGQQRRYRLLEPVRQFAELQLQASGNEPAVRRRHAAYFLALAEQMNKARDTPDEREWLMRIEPERDNIRAVNRWAIAHGERVFAHRFNGCLFAYWVYCSSLPEAAAWFAEILALPRANPSLAPTVEELHAEAHALNAAGYVASLSHLALAAQRFERELAIRYELGEPIAIASALRGISFIAMLRGDVAHAQQTGERALATSRAAGDNWGIAWSLFDLGNIALVRHDTARALGLLEESVPLLRAHGISFGLYRAMIALGHVMRLLGEQERAIDYYHQAFDLHRTMGYTQHITDALESLAGIAVDQQAASHAVVLFAGVETYRQANAIERFQYQQAWYERDYAGSRRQLATEAWQAAWESGWQLSLSQTIAYALDMHEKALPRNGTHVINGTHSH